MIFENKYKDGIDLAINESTLNSVRIGSNEVEVGLGCISMNENGEFPDDNRFKFIFHDFGRIALSFRRGLWDDESALIEKIDPSEIASKLNGLILDSMYGWEFIDLKENQFTSWSDKKSLDKVNKQNWSDMHTIDLFAEQDGAEPVTIDLRIWFADIQILDWNNSELSLDEFIQNGQRGWEQLYKTGITTTNNKTSKL